MIKFGGDKDEVEQCRYIVSGTLEAGTRRCHMFCHVFVCLPQWAGEGASPSELGKAVTRHECKRRSFPQTGRDRDGANWCG